MSERYTYNGFSLEELPSIPIELDDECEWLIRFGTGYAQDGLNHQRNNIQPALVEKLALVTHIKLPQSFHRFMSSPELQSQVRSCTDCYLDPGERIVETIGSVPGHLIHFLSDSQSCAHWYLHIHSSGDSAVLASPDLYCYQIEHSDWIENPFCRLECIDLNGLEFAYCAPSFSDFLYRFWIENEIWFKLGNEESKQTLSPLELKYLDHYKNLRIDDHRNDSHANREQTKITKSSFFEFLKSLLP